MQQPKLARREESPVYVEILKLQMDGRPKRPR